MSDEPTTPPAPAPAPTSSLFDLLTAEFKRLRARDGTISRLNNEVARRTNAMRFIHQLRKIAKVGIREQEKWLMEEAAANVRKATGVQTIPGFVSRRQSATEFRQAMKKKLKAATAFASTSLAKAPEPAAPAVPSETPPPT